MRDGVVLTTYIRVPTPCDAMYPSVMDRTPYGTTGGGSATNYNSAGFVSVEQNQRGCSSSGGTYDFWKDDGTDAYDTILWIVNQTWSNAKVYTVGTSADAISLYTDVFVPDISKYLFGQFPFLGNGYGHETCYWRGAYRTGLIKDWLYALTTCKGSIEVEQEIEQHEAYDDWWESLEIDGPYGDWYPDITWPSVQYAGWWDIFQQQQLDTYAGYVNGSHPDVRDQHYLFVQALGHCSGSNVDFSFPDNDVSDAGTLALAIFTNDSSNSVYSRIKHLNLYVLGTVPKYVDRSTTITGNYWTSSDQWPVTTQTRYYLASNGGLSTTKPATNANQTYLYDPKNPSPTYGGNNLFQTCGPRDQTQQVESRDDVLKFNQNSTLSQPFALCGHVIATLFVSSDQVDTDFVVSLNDVYPDGQSVQIRYGVVRMRWNTDYAKINLMTPGTIYQASVDLWSTCQILDAGHKLRVTVTSSSYPSYTANPNNGDPLSQSGPANVAKNTIYFGGDTASYVELPVVPVASLPKNNNIQ